MKKIIILGCFLFVSLMCCQSIVLAVEGLDSLNNGQSVNNENFSVPIELFEPHEDQQDILSDQKTEEAEYVPNEMIIKFKNEKVIGEVFKDLWVNKQPFNSIDADSKMDQLAEKYGIKTIQRLFNRSSREIHKGHLTLEQSKQLHKVASENTIKRVEKLILNKISSKGSESQSIAALKKLDFVYKVELESAVNIQKICDDFSQDDAVEYAQPNYLFKVAVIPNDPFYSSSGSWGQGYDDLWGLKSMQMEGAWNISEGQGVVVAVIDTGVDYNHPDILSNIWENTAEIADNGLDDDGNGFIDDVRGWDFAYDDNDPMDRHGHGTHVSGTIAATGNNNIGIIGVAPQSKIMSLKGLSDSGSGDTNNLAGAIMYAAENGAQVMNNSWGNDAESNPMIESAVRYAHALGTVVVFAAGNSERDVRKISPMNMYETITVSATEQDDGRTFFTNYGFACDVAAPGGGKIAGPPSDRPYYNILSLKSEVSIWPEALTVGNNYVRLAGTSMAAPHVAGLAALIRSVHPDFSTDDVRNTLRFAVNRIGESPEQVTKYLGTGRINAWGAVRLDHAPPTAKLQNMGDPIRGIYEIRGTAQSSENFGSYQLLYTQDNTPSERAWVLFHNSTTPVEDDVLGVLDTRELFDNELVYIKLLVGDHLGITSSHIVSLPILGYRVSITDPVVHYRHIEHLEQGEVITITGEIIGESVSLEAEYGEGVSPRTWFSDGMTLVEPLPEGSFYEGELASWDTSEVPPGIYTIRITMRTDSQEIRTAKTRVAINSLQGWPQHFPVYEPEAYQINTADLDGNGVKEVIILEKNLRRIGEPRPTLKVYSFDGRELAIKNFDGHPDLRTFDDPVIVDLDQDGFLEIIVAVNTDFLSPDTTTLHAYTLRDGTLVEFDGSSIGANWPLNIGNKIYPNIVVEDFDQDGHLEILYCERYTHHMMKRHKIITLSGQEKGQIDTPVGRVLTQHPHQAPATGNFDDDEELEIVFIDGKGKVFIFNPDGTMLPGWPLDLNTSMFYHPVVGDIDGDGYDNIVVTHYNRPFTDDDGEGNGSILERDGSLISSLFAAESLSGFPETPCLVDFEGDGTLEIAVVVGHTVLLFDDNGDRLWSRETRDVRIHMDEQASGPGAGDVDGDGVPDIIVNNQAGVYAWRQNGDPITLLGQPYLYTSAGSIHASAPVIDDLDGDGKTELLASGGVYYAGSRFLNVWNLDVDFHPEANHWPMYRHDLRNTSKFVNPSGENYFAEYLFVFETEDGIWSLNRHENQWNKLHDLSAKHIVSSRNKVIVDFYDEGIWTYSKDSREWEKFHDLSASHIVSSGNEIIVDFPDQGLWVYSKESMEWERLHDRSAAHIVSSGNEIIVDFPDQGIWVYSKNSMEWRNIHSLSAAHIVSSGNEIIVDFPGQGIWVYSKDSMEWRNIHSLSAAHIVSSGNKIIVDFPGQGIWVYLKDSLEWEQLHSSSARNIVSFGNEIIVDFPGQGIWVYLKDSLEWEQLHGLSASNITAVSLTKLDQPSQ